MAIIKKFSPNKNLTNYSTFLVDEQLDSFYFKITELEPTLTGGKNAFLIEGTDYLKETSEIQIEIKDVEGNSIYFEPGDGIPEYYEGTSKVVAVYVYEDTPIGEATITILGELKQYDDTGIRRDVPDEWKGLYNVKWERRIQLNKNLPNVTKVRFYKKPIITVTESSGSFFESVVVTSEDTGQVIGTAINPAVGTDLEFYQGTTFYKLTKTSGTFPDDIENNGTITVDGRLSNISVYEQQSETEILITTPYTEDNIIQSFTSTPYTASYSTTSTTTESPILGSFARFDFARLGTFAGDVARVKVFSKSATQNTDYVPIQDIRIESTELLQTTVSGSAVSYGFFSSDYETYWDVETLSHTVTQDNSKVFSGLKVDYDTGNSTPQTISSSLDLSLDANTEYTLGFNVLFSGSVDSSKTFSAYATYEYSGSYIEDEIVSIEASDLYKNVQSLSQNYIAPYDGDYKIKFSVSGDDWYFGKVSYRASQETSFSPDSLQFTIPVTRNLERETLDFKFEFYDINNNFIPIDVTSQETFIGGNLTTIDKSIDVDSSPGFVFTFDSDKIATPDPQTLNLIFTKNRVVNDLVITSQSFDTGGVLIPTSSYSGYDYPGQLNLVSNTIYEEQYTLDIADFTGSLHGNPPSGGDIIVGSIRYTLTETGSLVPVSRTFTITRQDDGEKTKEVSLRANPQTFYYKRTDLAPKKSQTTTISATKGNLPPANEFTITSGSYGALVKTSGTIETETYTIQAGTTAQSGVGSNYLDYNDGPATYSFEIDDRRGVPYSASIDIDTVIVEDSLNVKTSQDTHNFTAESTGEVLDPLSEGDVDVNVFVGGEQISYDSGFANNTWCVTNYSGTNVTAKSLSDDGTTATVGITAFPDSNNSGSLSFRVDYKDGLGSTESVTRTVNYTKAKKAAPVLEFQITPNNQSVAAFSTGVQTGTFSDATSTVNEQYDGSSSNLTLTTLNAEGSDVGVVSTTPATGLIDLSSNSFSNGVDSDTVNVNGTVVDSEGTTRSVSGSISLGKVRSAEPTTIGNLSLDTQSVQKTTSGYCTPTNITVSVSEGNTDYTYDDSVPYADCTFRVTSVTNGSNSNCTITPDTPTTDAGITTTIDVSYVNSEGTTGTLSKIHTVGVAAQGERGPGILYVGEYSTKCTNDPTFALKNNDISQDIVSSGGNYYAWEGTDGTAINTTTAPPSANWSAAFTSFSAIATGLLIAENSFVQCTINVGTNASGTAANIAIVGNTTVPYIALGQSTHGYGNTGIFIGCSNRISLVGGGGSLSFDGTNLSVNGSVTITGGSGVSNLSDAGTLATCNTITTALVTDTGTLATCSNIPLTCVSDAGAMAAINAINSGNVTTYIGSGAIVSSVIAANTIVAGNIAANTITASEIASNTITASQIAAGTITASEIAANSIGTSELCANSVDAGNIISLCISGCCLIADTGTIGGWTMCSNCICANAGTINLKSSGTSIASKVGIVTDNVLPAKSSNSVISTGASAAISTGWIKDTTTRTFTAQSISGCGRFSATIDVCRSGITFNRSSSSLAATHAHCTVLCIFVKASGTTVYSCGVTIVSNSNIGTGPFSSTGGSNFSINVLTNEYSLTGCTSVDICFDVCSCSSVSAGGGTAAACVLARSAASDTYIATRGSNCLSEISPNGIQTSCVDASAVRVVQLGPATDLAGSQNAAGFFSCHLYVNGTVYCNGQAGISDSRAKLCISNITSPLDSIRSLCGRCWDWNDQVANKYQRTSINGIGVIADDAQESFPHLVFEREFNGISNFKHFDYNALHGYYIEAIKELADKVDELGATIGTLTDCISYLESNISGSQ